MWNDHYQARQSKGICVAWGNLLLAWDAKQTCTVTINWKELDQINASSKTKIYNFQLPHMERSGCNFSRADTKKPPVLSMSHVRCKYCSKNAIFYHDFHLQHCSKFLGTSFRCFPGTKIAVSSLNMCEQTWFSDETKTKTINSIGYSNLTKLAKVLRFENS